MKKIFLPWVFCVSVAIILIACITLVLCSCSGGFSKGVKKDLTTGLSTSYNGLSIEDIYLATDDTRLNSNTIPLGSKINIIATGVDYFTEKNGKVFPGCTIILTDKDRKEILNLPDAFADLTNGTPASEAKTLKASLTTGDPMVMGATYHLYVRFYDKNKKESEIVSNVSLVMK